MTDSLIEAIDAGASKAGRYRVRIIAAGLSGNSNYYPDQTLRESVPLFDGVRVFVKGDEEHLRGGGKDFRNLVGKIANPRFVAGASVDSGAVDGELHLIEADGPIAVKLHEAVTRGMTDLFGLSIDADGRVRAGRVGDRSVRIATKFVEVKSVDLIVSPGAGGRVISFMEAQGVSAMDDVVLNEKTVATSIKGSGLPAAAQKALHKKFASREDVTEVELHEAIELRREVAAELTESGTVRMGDFPARTEHVAGAPSKADQMLDAFFDVGSKDHKHARSFKECYVALTGDRRVTGRIGDCDLALMRETFGDSFRESCRARPGRMLSGTPSRDR